MQPIMPNKMYQLLNAVAVDKFDPMIGYPVVMATTAGIVQKLARLQISNAYKTTLSLYFLTIAPSGSGKGAVSTPILEPLQELVLAKREQDARENEKRRHKNAAIRNIIDAKKKQARRVSGPAMDCLMDELKNLEGQLQPELQPYLFDVQDVTTASLVNDLSQQPGTSLSIIDTEGRFMRSLDEDKSLASLLNQGFVGETVNNRRVSSKSSVINCPHISITAAIQPDKLKRLVRNRNLWGEGFIPRTLPYFAGTPSIFASAIGEITDTEILNWWARRLEYLFRLPLPTNPAGRVVPQTIYLDTQSKILFAGWATRVQTMIKEPAYRGLEANLSRLPTITARLAAIYHFIDHPSPLDHPVTGGLMQQAINASQFFLSHVCQLYTWFNPNPVEVILPKVCYWLRSRAGTGSGYVTLKEIYGGCGVKKEGLYKAIEYLCNIGVLQIGNKFRKPDATWASNPAIESYGYIINFSALENINY